MRKMEIELKVGLFITIGVGLVLAAILILGSTESLIQRKDHFVSHLPTAEGLISGAKVVLGGIPVGTVESMRFDGEHHDVEVRFSVSRDEAKWVRADSSIEVLTQGVLGDKYVSINAGSLSQPEISDGGEVPNRPSKDLSQFLSKGDQLLISLNTISSDLDRILQAFDRNGRADMLFDGLSSSSRNLSQITAKLNSQMDNLPLRKTISNLNGILEKINNGSGSLGALINDPSLYDNVTALIGGANQNRVIRNLVRRSVEQGIRSQPNQ